MGDLKVEKIQNGTVIDRIDAFKGIRVLEMLNLISREGEGEKIEIPRCMVALLVNVPSKKIGRKDILKIDGRALRPEEVSKIALIAPNATLNIISNSAVVKKQALKMPAEISGIAICPNQNCVCQNQKIKGKFFASGKGFRCHFCERVFDAHELVF